MRSAKVGIKQDFGRQWCCDCVKISLASVAQKGQMCYIIA